jgi:hypothetical protein
MVTRTDVIKRHIKAIYASFDRAECISKITTPFFEDKTDGNFTQIGLAVKLDRHLFDPNEPPLGGLDIYGTDIANGEATFLIKEILKQNKETIDLNPISFKKALLEIMKFDKPDSRTSVLISYNTQSKLLSDPSYSVIWDDQYMSFVVNIGIKARIYSFGEEVIGNNILIINRDSIWTLTLHQKNPLTKNLERLSVKVEEITLPLKTKFEIKTVIKIILRDPEKLKILKAKE